VIGKLIRLPLRAIPPDTVVPVLSGINRGMRWRVGSSVHGCWLGTYEAAKQRAMREIVRPGMSAWDIGANVGFYTLGMSALGAKVRAFEPLPANLIDLRRHIAINRLTVDVQSVAVSDKGGTRRFSGSGATGRLTPEGLAVRTVRLDDLDGLPDVVKIDVEGGELAVLRGASGLIAKRRTIWLVALDDPANNAACRAIFRDAGYHVEDLGSRDEIIART
jgi:FkbM family methyltransferase